MLSFTGGFDRLATSSSKFLYNLVHREALEFPSHALGSGALAG